MKIIYRFLNINPGYLICFFLVTFFNFPTIPSIAGPKTYFESKRPSLSTSGNLPVSHAVFTSNNAQITSLRKLHFKQERTAQTLIFGGSVLLLLLFIVSYSRFKLKRLTNLKLKKQQNEIELKNSSLKKIENDKENLIKQKEWLMQEIHHRVKNNLQIVISLLNTQSAYLDDVAAYNAIRESQHRMQSISLIHQKLYQSDSLAMVSLPAYIDDLITYLSDSFNTAPRILFETRLVPLELEVTKAVPVGLIINEAITNSIKYAFPKNSNGKIMISIDEISDNDYQLAIRDNGIGLAQDHAPGKSHSLGMTLMRGLSKQICGDLEIENKDGVCIIIKFNNQKAQEPLQSK
jgi:two-component sensor histidine kinase